MTIAQSPTLERVAAAAERGSLEEALFLLGAVLDAQRVDDALFESTVRRLAQAATSAGAKRTAVLAWLYVGAKDEAERAAELAGDRMRVARARGNLAKAASEAEAAGWLGHAGLLLAGLGRHDEAATRFERLLERPAIEADAYVRGLVAYDLCLAWRGTNQGERAAEAMIEALRALEAAADGYETRGQRERAFDCTQVLIALGREGAFENLAEGYVNAIRILREDGLKHHAIRYLDDFVTLSRERGELHAAASAAREAADYARRLGLPYEARFRRLAADAYVAAAERGLATGLPVELAENAYVAAIDQWNTLGAYASIRATALALASLPLERRKQVRYTGLAERLRDAVDRPNPSVELPDTLRSPAAYPDVWRSDVIDPSRRETPGRRWPSSRSIPPSRDRSGAAHWSPAATRACSARWPRKVRRPRAASRASSAGSRPTRRSARSNGSRAMPIPSSGPPRWGPSASSASSARSAWSRTPSRTPTGRWSPRPSR